MGSKRIAFLIATLSCCFVVGCKSIERANAKAIARNVDSALSAYQAEHGTLPRNYEELSRAIKLPPRPTLFYNFVTNQSYELLIRSEYYSYSFTNGVLSGVRRRPW